LIGATHSNSQSAQDQRVLDALRRGPQTTLALRREQDVLMPSSSVFRLRDKGFDIDTVLVRRETDCGKPHYVALYSLTGEPAPDLQN
jgi:hypothetical protein